jgi:hypothetical protein
VTTFAARGVARAGFAADAAGRFAAGDDGLGAAGFERGRAASALRLRAAGRAGWTLRVAVFAFGDVFARREAAGFAAFPAGVFGWVRPDSDFGFAREGIHGV